MRRLAGVLFLTLVTAAALSGAALAKEGGVELSSTPSGKGPGEPWTTSLVLIDGTPELLAQARPGITIRNVDSGAETTYRAKPTSDPQVWTVRVVFPTEGWWTVNAFDGVTGRSYTIGGQYLIEGPKATPVAPTASSGDGQAFPVWPVTGGAIALFLAAVGAALFLRRQRLGLTH